jgi:hypothetical protein
LVQLLQNAQQSSPWQLQQLTDVFKLWVNGVGWINLHARQAWHSAPHMCMGHGWAGHCPEGAWMLCCGLGLQMTLHHV